MKRTKESILQLLLFTLSLHLVLSKTYRIRTGKSTDCDYRGYAPGGKVKDIGKIEAPTATMASNGLSDVLAGMGKGIEGSQVGLDVVTEFTEKFAKVAPKLGMALGVFGAAFGEVNSMLEPGPQDILNSVNTAIEKLTDEMNTKLEQMEGYVDTRVINSARDMVQNHYKSSYRYWEACTREITAEGAEQCQLTAVKRVVSERPLYAVIDSKVINKEDLDSYERRKLEASLILFRDYANLVILQLTALVDKFCAEKSDQGKAQCKRFSEDMDTEVRWYIKYVENAVHLIEKSHQSGGPCNDTSNKAGSKHKITKGKVVKKTIGSWFECSCVIDDSNTKQTCKVKATMRTDGNHLRSFKKYKFDGVSHTRDVARKFCDLTMKHESELYQKKNGPVVKKYWKVNVLSMIPTWRKALKKAQHGIKLSDEGFFREDIPLRGEYAFSEDLQRRLVKAGFK